MYTLKKVAQNLSLPVNLYITLSERNHDKFELYFPGSTYLYKLDG